MLHNCPITSYYIKYDMLHMYMFGECEKETYNLPLNT